MGAVKPAESVGERPLIDALVPPAAASADDTPKQSAAKQKQQRDALDALVAKAEQVRAGASTFTADEVQTLLASLILAIR